MLLTLPIIIPLACAVLVAAVGGKNKFTSPALAALGTLGALAAVLFMFAYPLNLFYVSWVEPFLNIHLSAGQFQRLILLAVTVFSTLVLIYSINESAQNGKWFYFSYLITISFACGAVLADNLVLMLFFWEGLLIPLYIFIILNKDAKETAFRAFIINAVGDIFLLAGIIMVGVLAGSFETSSARPIQLYSYSGVITFLLLAVGALSKAGAFPFHSWIPDAAKTTNTSFLALLPGALEKLLAVFLLGKMSVLFDMSQINNGGDILFILSLFSIVLASLVLIREMDLKKFVAYNVVLQIGLLAFEKGVHMNAPIMELANHGVYKAAALACLFICSGVIEKAAGTTDSNKLGGLFKAMPVTAVCFIISAMALTKVTYLDMFASESFYGVGTNHPYILAFLVISQVLVLGAFVRIIYNTFFSAQSVKAKEQTITEKAVPAILAIVVFAYSIGWVFDEAHLINLHHAHFSANWVTLLIALSLAAAIAMAFGAYKKHGARQACVLNHGVLDKCLSFTESADTFNIIKAFTMAFSKVMFRLDRMFDFIIDDIPSTVAKRFSKKGSVMHTGYHLSYILWAIFGAIVFAVIALSGGWM
ncbi:NADH-quinone oxidoreductase subunit L [Elusimicrobium posterum]|uniref:proton-conducting transporter transmembrane domain-containing protein n=1 Tax=Elusimicrobium posterum TaxID=3116653 RepID=UPI003C739ADC